MAFLGKKENITLFIIQLTFTRALALTASHSLQNCVDVSARTMSLYLEEYLQVRGVALCLAAHSSLHVSGPRTK